MRVMRSTILSPEGTSLSTIIRDCDVNDTLESVRERTKQPGALCVYDIFEMPDDTEVNDCVIESIDRAQERHDTEANMALSYYWNGAQLARIVTGGTLVNDQPAPLGVDDCAIVLEQLVTHPNYNRHTISVVAEDGEVVTLRDGQLEDQT